MVLLGTSSTNEEYDLGGSSHEASFARRPLPPLSSRRVLMAYVCRCVVQPFLETRFTQGIVDGGERGSSKGLGPLLRELLEHIKEVCRRNEF